jgi:hypothetical protein
MKNSIKVAALFLLASVGIFASTPAKAMDGGAIAVTDVITFSSLPSHKGVDIKVDRATAGKAVVIISDSEGNVVYKDVLPQYKAMEKGYILNSLENGDYTIEVTSNKQVVKKDIHVYNEDKTKVFIVKQ